MGMSSASKKNKNEHHTYTLKPENDLRSIYEYLDIDPDFSNPDFIEKVSNLYVRFQNEWQNKNIEPLRPYMTSAMFAQMDRQLDKYRQNILRYSAGDRRAVLMRSLSSSIHVSWITLPMTIQVLLSAATILMRSS